MFTHVDIIGLGGTGSNLITNLIRLFLYNESIPNNLEINLIDGDIIEDKNIERGFENEGVSKYKVEYIKDKIIEQFEKEIIKKNFSINTINNYIKKNDYYMLLNTRSGRRSKTLCIAAVDNDHARKEIIEAIESQNKWVLFMSPGNAELDGQVISWLKDKNQEITPSPLKLYPQLVNANPSLNPGSCSYNSVNAPQLLATNMMAASATLAQVTQVLLDKSFMNYVGFNLIGKRTPTGTLIKIKEIPTII